MLSKNNFLVFISVLILIPAMSSQELDDRYLESLPEEVREEVMRSIEEREDDEEIKYRRPSTMIDKDDEEREDNDDY